ncbi:MAG: hypothetical protein GC160_26120 [Acidobacteria bacterium]|nr:hypothetical protein [Acidobacteriota bacterium]
MLRRDFFPAAAAAATAGLAACAPAPAPDRNAMAIKITGVEIFRIEVNSRGPWCVIRVQTDAGLTGIGDASHSGKDDPAIGKIKEYAEVVKRGSIFDIEALRAYAHPQYKEGGRAVSCALSALEQALYDLQGKAMGVPCWALFGGKMRDQIRNYANINRSTDDRVPAGFAERAGQAIDAGFTAIKMASFDGMPRNGSAAEIEAHTKLGIECAQAVRDRIGLANDLLVDAHNNFDYERGLDLMKRMEPLELFFLEEISRPIDVFSRLKKQATMPIAGGESLFGVQEYWPYLVAETVNIAMPDVKYCGGMLELKKIAAMAESNGVQCSPHGPASPVGNMAAAHVCATLPNFLILEYSYGDAVEWRAEMTNPPEPLEKGGMLRVPDTPGLGYELNDTLVEKRLVDKATA